MKTYKMHINHQFYMKYTQLSICTWFLEKQMFTFILFISKHFIIQSQIRNIEVITFSEFLWKQFV